MIPRRWAEADTQGGAEKPSPSLRQSLRQPPRGIGRTAAVRRSRGAERRQPAPGGIAVLAPDATHPGDCVGSSPSIGANAAAFQDSEPLSSHDNERFRG